MKKLLLAIAIIALVALVGTYPLTILSKIFDWLSLVFLRLAEYDWGGLIH